MTFAFDIFVINQVDALSNAEFGVFSQENRIMVDLDNLGFILLPELLDFGAKLYDLTKEEKALKRVRLVPASSVAKTPLDKRLKTTDPS